MVETRKLTEKQKAFADVYIRTLNAAEAAREAGYSPNCAREMGYENLTKPHIKAYIDKRLQELEDKRIAKAKEVLEYLTSVMREEVDEEVIIVEGAGEGHSEARIMRKAVSIRERNKAAELLGRRYALFTDKLDIDGSVGVQIIDNIPDDDGDDED